MFRRKSSIAPEAAPAKAASPEGDDDDGATIEEIEEDEKQVIKGRIMGRASKRFFRTGADADWRAQTGSFRVRL